MYIIWVVYKLFFLQEFENKALYSGKARKNLLILTLIKNLTKKIKIKVKSTILSSYMRFIVI